MDVREFMHILRNDPYTRKYNPKFVFSNELPAKILPNRYDFNDSTHFQIWLTWEGGSITFQFSFFLEFL